MLLLSKRISSLAKSAEEVESKLFEAAGERWWDASETCSK